MSERMDGAAFRRLMAAAHRKLHENRDQVNALNVFPVPDGDTGNNMSLTMEAALNELSRTQSSDVGTLAQAVATGALMGSRGNSGVILSQLFRGFASGLDGRQVIDGRSLAYALRRASESAYANLLKPVEGTILTVARVGAEKAAQCLRETQDASPGEVLAAACHGAEEALEATPDLLPVLKSAGVVDAGGQGLVWLLRGMLEAWQLRSDEVGAPRGDSASSNAERVLAMAGRREVQFELTEQLGDIHFPYDTELLLRGAELPVGLLRERLETMGDSVLVVGNDALVKVHVHTDRPDRVLALMLEHGLPYDVLIKDMRVQYDELETRATGQAVTGESNEQEATGATVQHELDAPAVVAVASGEGFGQLFMSLGARQVIPGGQTMNPATGDIAAAVEATGCDSVIVLPNNSNVILSCEQARQLTDVEVLVVPTKSMPAGIIALLALRPGEDAVDNVGWMTDAIANIVTGEVTYAVRETSVNGVEVKQGDILGICGGDIRTRGSDREQCLFDTITRSLFDGSTLVSVYVGADVGEDEVEPLWKRLEAAFPEYDIEVQYGGQPHYYYAFSIE